MKPVDFICVGAEKCGTTWLADQLRQHPDVFVPEIKEVHYFNERNVAYPEIHNINYAKSLDWYHQFFREARCDQIRGEFSVSYLPNKNTAQDIFSYNENIKIIVMLRNPMERSWSQFQAYRSRGILATDQFWEATEQRPDIIERSRYSHQLGRFVSQYPQNQLLITLFDEMTADPASFLKKIEDFLQVEYFIPNDVRSRSNVTNKARFPFLARVLEGTYRKAHSLQIKSLISAASRIGLTRLFTGLRALNTHGFSTSTPLPADVRHRLFEVFREDIAQLEVILGRELSQWKPLY